MTVDRVGMLKQRMEQLTCPSANQSAGLYAGKPDHLVYLRLRMGP
jgi:hypothetical protein